jgi:hypothetical protein
MMAYAWRQLAAGGVALAVVVGADQGTRNQSLPHSDPAAIVESQGNQSGQLAPAWLASGDARLRAWGAYLVLRDRRHELVPRLVELANAYSVKTGPLGATDRDEHDAMLSVLDAVIQLEGRIPAEVSQTPFSEA